jgi:hypothetical protein
MSPSTLEAALLSRCRALFVVTTSCVVFASPAIARADDPAASPPPAAAPTPAPVNATTLLGITFSGMVDAYISINPLRKGKNLADNGLRAFDLETNRASLSYAEIAAERTAGPAGFRIDLGFGPTAALVNSTDIAAGNTAFANIEQAYLQYKPTDGVVLKLGKMVTHHGYEVIESQLNYNYSRSLLFTYAIPYTETGLSATFSPSSTADITVFLVNGLNNTRDNNAFKSPGLQVALRPADGLSLMLNYSAFNEAPGAAGGALKFDNAFELFDFVATYSKDGTDVGCNFDLGYDPTVAKGRSTLFGAAGYVQRALSSKIKVAGRAEVFYDSASPTLGVPGVDNGDVAEATATLSYAPADGFLLRGEARFDRALGDYKPFLDASGAPTASQVTLTLGAVASF